MAPGRRSGGRPVGGGKDIGTVGGAVGSVEVSALRKDNPFQPGAGALPPFLAGRDAELALAGGMLDSLRQGHAPSRGLLFYGPRGNGKTTLLARIAEDARRRGLRAESLPVAAFRSPAALIRCLQEKAGLVGMRLRGDSAAGFGGAAEPVALSEDAGALLAHWIGAEPTPLLILLDEAQAIGADAGRAFAGGIQEATTGSLPFVLLAAGTPDAPRRLREAGPFLERALRRRRIGRLDREDAERALLEPARDSGLPLRPDAAAFLAAESQTYPYFIQLLGSAAWQSAADGGADEITMDSARAGVAAVRPEIESFFGERFDEARGRGVHRALAPLAALLGERDGRLDDDELDEFLARQPAPPQGTPLLETLKDLGVLWETRPGVWEMGIPSFADHILRRTQTAQTPTAGPPASGALRT